MPVLYELKNFLKKDGLQLLEILYQYHMKTCLQGLFRKILNGHIKPGELVKMTPEELASKELARWREFEAKHVRIFSEFLKL